MAQRLGEGVAVRSDDVEGNQVSGAAWLPSSGAQEHPFVAVFTDDGDVTDCAVSP
ncbi:MAG TPA: hypothetical protein VG184_00270 [Acidimicrobiales bacterium]|nr:hypothetical protein [Acidimicrobiales bacterium]